MSPRYIFFFFVRCFQFFHVLDKKRLQQQYKSDPETLNQRLEIKRAEFDQVGDALYSSYGTTDQAFVTYMNRNKKAVNAYLQANPEIQQQIDSLSAQLNALIQEEDALRQISGNEADDSLMIQSP